MLLLKLNMLRTGYFILGIKGWVYALKLIKYRVVPRIYDNVAGFFIHAMRVVHAIFKESTCQAVMMQQSNLIFFSRLDRNLYQAQIKQIKAIFRIIFRIRLKGNLIIHERRLIKPNTEYLFLFLN